MVPGVLEGCLGVLGACLQLSGASMGLGRVWVQGLGLKSGVLQLDIQTLNSPSTFRTEARVVSDAKGDSWGCRGAAPRSPGPWWVEVRHKMITNLKE